MIEEIVVPKMGESVTSGIIAAWLKEDGVQVEEGDEIFELETDKATLAVPTTAGGLLSRKANEGDEVEVGQVVALVDTEGAAKKSASQTEAERPPTEKPDTDDRGEEGHAETQPGGGEKASKSMAQPQSDEGTPSDTAGTIPEGVTVSPSVRRIIEQYRIDFSSIEASGQKGRITKEDALAALLKKAEATLDRAESARSVAAGSRAAGTAGDSADRDRGAGTKARDAERPESERRPMSNLRKRIAENLVQSKQNSAHLTTFNEIDLSAVMAIRSSYRDAFEKKHGVRLGFMSFFVKASCAALKAFPQANAAIDGDDLILHYVQNIGVAVSTDRGLIVPVIKNADSKSFAEIESEIISFATRAREKKIGVDELTGGTFSITNGGVFGSLLSTPIPTPGQAAILGMHSIQKRPVAIDDSVVIRPMMYVAVTYDHRIMDGREAVSFLVKIKELIEDPHQMLLDM